MVAQAIDNVVRPLLIKKGADLSLLLIFPGVIGGLLWLGIIGLFVGPVILAVTSTLLEGWMSGLGETAPEGAPAVAAGARQTVPHRPGEWNRRQRAQWASIGDARSRPGGRGAPSVSRTTTGLFTSSIR